MAKTTVEIPDERLAELEAYKEKWFIRLKHTLLREVRRF